MTKGEKKGRRRSVRKRKKGKKERNKKRKRERKGDEVVDMWVEESGLSTTRLASRIGKIVCGGDDSSREESSSSKKIGDVDEEMHDVEEGLRKEALSSTLRVVNSSKAGTSRQTSGALNKEVKTTESGTDAYDFPDYTPNASDYDSERDGVVDSCEDQRSRQRTKSAGGSFKTKNKDVVVNLMSAFMNSLDEREAAGLPRDPSASWKEASLVLHADEHISEEEKEEKVEKKEKKKEVSFEKEEEKSRKERRKQKEEE